MPKRRVVITGLNAVTSLSHNNDDFWKLLCDGKSGIGKITSFDTSDIGVHIGGEISNLNIYEWFDVKEARRLDRFTQFAVISSTIAIDDSGLDLDATDRKRVGVIIGSGIGGLSELEKQLSILFKRGPSKVSPMFIPKAIINAAACHVSLKHKLYGPNYAIVSACASGSNAIGNSYRLILNGKADIMVAGGSEAAISPLCMSGFCNMRALSISNNSPETVSRPFDKDRDGFVIAEGAGIVILEELEHAKKRGANIYCELSGYGMSSDAFHIASPDPSGKGACAAMFGALKEANANMDQIDYVNAHATSTPLGDKIEANAIYKTFGDHAKNICVGSTKSSIGHLLGAAGGVETVICAMAVCNNVIPPTINCDNPDPECCGLDFVPNKAREKQVNKAMCNSFGFGGHNVCLIIEKFKD